jgi:hypothetical protein
MKFLLASVLASALVVNPCSAQDGKPPMTEKPGEQPAEKAPAEKPKEAAQPVRQTENLPTADALKGEKNRLVRASYVGPGRIGEGSLRVMRVAPKKLYQTLEVPGIITQEVWCDGEEGWMRDTNNGTNKLKGDALIEFKRQADFLGEANYKVRYKEIKTIYGEKFADVDAFAVKAVPTEGKERTIYFDAKSGYIIGFRMPGPGGPDTDMVTTLSDYKKFGEVMQPVKSVTKQGPGETVITIKKIDSNLTAMPSTEPPDEVRSVK